MRWISMEHFPHGRKDNLFHFWPLWGDKYFGNDLKVIERIGRVRRSLKLHSTAVTCFSITHINNSLSIQYWNILLSNRKTARLLKFEFDEMVSIFILESMTGDIICEHTVMAQPSVAGGIEPYLISNSRIGSYKGDIQIAPFEPKPS